jgi:hypothetical protein
VQRASVLAVRSRDPKPPTRPIEPILHGGDNGVAVNACDGCSQYEKQTGPPNPQSWILSASSKGKGRREVQRGFLSHPVESRPCF